MPYSRSRPACRLLQYAQVSWQHAGSTASQQPHASALSVLCRGAVPEPAEAAGDIQFVLRTGAQPPPQAGLQARQPQQCSHVVAVCWCSGPEADQVPGLQLAPIRAGESSTCEASCRRSASSLDGAPTPMYRTSVNPGQNSEVEASG